MDVLYVEARYKRKLIEEEINNIREALKPYKRINIVAAVQFLDQMKQVIESIKDKEFVVLQSKYRAYYPGQILGCDVYAAGCNDCDITLSLTQGLFHVYGILEKYGKPVINFDPTSGEIKFFDEEFARKLYLANLAAISSVINAKTVLIVHSIKAGQTSPIRQIKDWLKTNGKEYYEILFDEINFEYLNELPGDAIINTACQRIAKDDKEKLNKPIVNAEDLYEYLFG